MKKVFNLRNLFVILSIGIALVLITYCVGAYYAYFYPIKYSDEIEVLSEKYGVNSAIVASVANVESNYNENAISNKGAVGIMQLMPSTAKWLASKIEVEYNEEKLKDPLYNLELGIYYLALLIEHFQDERVGICAYNAGQGNVSAWLAQKEYSSDGKTLDYIPFVETRNYLAKVLNNYNYYKNKYK